MKRILEAIIKSTLHAHPASPPHRKLLMSHPLLGCLVIAQSPGVNRIIL